MLKIKHVSLLVWLYAAIVGMLCGCNTTDPAGRTIASVVVTVDGAMKGWAVWVHNGLATTEQELKVKAAYEKYVLAMRTAQAAYGAAVKVKNLSIAEQAIAAMQNSESELLALIAAFQKGTVK